VVQIPKVELLQDTEDGKKGDIVELNQTAFDIYTRENMGRPVNESAEEVEQIGEELEEPDWAGEISDELDEAEERYPKWPGDETESGEKLIGEVVRTGEGPNGRLIVVQDAQTDKKLTVWESKALQDLMENVNAGDCVGLKFRGWRKSSAGQQYKDIQHVHHPAG